MICEEITKVKPCCVLLDRGEVSRYLSKQSLRLPRGKKRRATRSKNAVFLRGKQQFRTSSSLGSLQKSTRSSHNRDTSEPSQTTREVSTPEVEREHPELVHTSARSTLKTSYCNDNPSDISESSFTREELCMSDNDENPPPKFVHISPKSILGSLSAKNNFLWDVNQRVLTREEIYLSKVDFVSNIVNNITPRHQPKPVTSPVCLYNPSQNVCFDNPPTVCKETKCDKSVHNTSHYKFPTNAYKHNYLFKKVPENISYPNNKFVSTNSSLLKGDSLNVKNTEDLKINKLQCQISEYLPNVSCFLCPNCPASFSNKILLNLHFQSMHSSKVDLDKIYSQPKPHIKCKKCFLYFFEQYQLERHLEICKSLHNQLKCNSIRSKYCFTNYRNILRVKKHCKIFVLRKQNNKCVYFCNICKESFSKKSDLKSHIVVCCFDNDINNKNQLAKSTNPSVTLNKPNKGELISRLPSIVKIVLTRIPCDDKNTEFTNFKSNNTISDSSKNQQNMQRKH